MGWVRALLERVLLLSIVLFSLTCALGQLEVGGQAGGGLRIALFLASLFALLEEWRRLNRNIVKARQAIVAVGVDAPRRPELGCHGCLAVVLVLPATALGLAVASDFWTASGSEIDLGRWMLSTIGWSVVNIHWFMLVIGGFSWATTNHRFRREVPRAARPAMGKPMPWVTLAMVTPLLVVALVKWPNRAAARGAGTAGMPGLLSALEIASQIASTAPQAGGATPGDGRVELLLELGNDDTIDEIAPTLRRHGATVVRAFDTVSMTEDPDLAQTWVITVTADQAQALQRQLAADPENVDVIELNSAVPTQPSHIAGRCPLSGRRLSLLPVDDPYAPDQWALERVHASTVLGEMGRSRPRRQGKVAVLDTGVSDSLPELAGVVHGDGVDYQGHGTQVASVAAAISDNGRGIASLNLDGRWVQVYDHPVLAIPGVAADDVAREIIDAADDGVDVINLSFGARGTAPTAVHHAVVYALSKDTLVVAAAGNDATDVGAAGQWPANIPGVIAVGAIDENGQPRGNRVGGVKLGIYAPGADVCVGTAEGGYQLASGSSYAAPMVSSLIAVLAARCPSTSAVQRAQAVLGGATNGLLDASAAWDALDACR